MVCVLCSLFGVYVLSGVDRILTMLTRSKTRKRKRVSLESFTLSWLIGEFMDMKTLINICVSTTVATTFLPLYVQAVSAAYKGSPVTLRRWDCTNMFKVLEGFVSSLVLRGAWSAAELQGVFLSVAALAQLTFGDTFNHPLVPGVFPGTLTQLTFGSNFNQLVVPSILPGTLRQLHFGYCFNQPLVPGVFPASLRQLKFGHFFNQPLAAGVLLTSATISTSRWYRVSCLPR
jgi:hypothetical protein